MYRKSIHDTKQRFEEALREVYNLISNGKREKEIPDILSNKHQENEIKQLLKDISKIHILEEHQFLTNSLKITLWILLFFRFLAVHSFLNSIELNILWEILIFILSILFLIMALILAYKETPLSYNIIFLIMALYFVSSTSLIDNLVVIFTTSPFSWEWLFLFIVTIAFLWAVFASWRLFRLFPASLLSTERAIRKLDLNFDNFLAAKNQVTDG